MIRWKVVKFYNSSTKDKKQIRRMLNYCKKRMTVEMDICYWLRETNNEDVSVIKHKLMIIEFGIVWD